MINHEEAGKNLQQIDQKLDEHPLLRSIASNHKKHKLPTTVIGDPQRLQQVVFNLMNNALKNTSQGSITVNINFNPDESKLIFDITDKGKGIKKDEQMSLFKLFGRNHTGELNINDD